jgi:hypothetical protein
MYLPQSIVLKLLSIPGPQLAGMVAGSVRPRERKHAPPGLVIKIAKPYQLYYLWQHSTEVNSLCDTKC